MPPNGPDRDGPSDARLRLQLLGMAAVLAVVVLGILYLIVPPAWLEAQHVLMWTAPSVVVAAGVALASAQHLLEILRGQRADVVRLRELVGYRERERDLAQDELIHRIEAERNLARDKMQFEAQLAAYEKYAALAQLALGAAHEINNPLLGILSHLELQLKDVTDPDEREEIQQCIQGAKRISTTLHGLINYARPGPLLLTKVHIGRLVEDTLSFLRYQPMFRPLKVETNIAHDLPAITADSNQLSQILMNLLLNAAEATPEGGAISIEAQKIKFMEYVEIAVRDTGCGIPADILPHVLEPFFTTKRGKGTGLGLSISHAYVRSHGGDIKVESLPGRGTTVRIVLPIRQAGKADREREEENDLVIR
ncbi:MAG: sensor histidine kinase [Terriglobales bacterium]